ncbi:MAG: aminotransferase class V-fold PLP-dependent enzyme [Actinomycetota bacterium]|nr:aminotransferase class V-fold PLP-dependent enzyme [Actinomycetota bacterium]
MADRLLKYRDRFPILKQSAYLASHSLGAMSQEVREELAAYTDAWDTLGVRAWQDGWWELPITVGDELAPILGAPPGSVAMFPNVTLAEGVVASCFSFQPPRNRVVLSELDFPSVQYLWHPVPGAEVVTVPSQDGLTVETDDLLKAIDERTAVVPISHVLFRSGFLQDIPAISARAREVGARVVLDCYQSAGVLPFSLVDLQVDFAVGGSVKWLCGGPGAGWLYVRHDLQQELEPRLVGWQADREPFAFRSGRIQYAGGMWRFLNGTPNVPGLHAARAGYRMIQEVGVEPIRDKSLWMTQWIIDMAHELDIPVTSEREPKRRGGTVTLGLPDEATVASALAEEGVIVDSRPEAGVRVGPHFYNSEDDLARLRKKLIRLLGL